MPFTYTTEIFNEYPDCSYATAIVYSYMLSQHQKQNEFVESQDSISINSGCSIARTKTAIKWLKDQGLITISKAQNSFFNENQYTVHDRYGVYCDRHYSDGVKHTRSTSVYLFKINTTNQQFLKVGFSANTFQRFNAYKITTDAEYEILHSKTYESIVAARCVEQEIHQALALYKEDVSEIKKIMSNGFTECYKVEFEDKVTEVFKKLTAYPTFP